MLVAGPGVDPRSEAGAGVAAAADGYGRVALSFEPNRGQSDRRVRFLSRGSGYALFLTQREAVLALRNPRPSRRGRPSVLRLQFAGANRSARIEGVESLASRVNYFQGRDPRRWRKNVPTFAKVRYSGIYRGVDLVLYGNQRQLEYDFVVAPGTDPDAIALRFRGARRLALDGNGDLLVRVGGRTLRQRRPVAYQRVGSRRVGVLAGYVLEGSTVRFRLGSYDRSRSLVIDPVLPLYATYLGGSQGDGGTAIDVDGAGNAYVAGWTFSADFPLSAPLQGPGGYDSRWCSWADPCPDVFVAKMNAAGTEVVYSTFVGGDRADRALGIDVDAGGNAYVTGGSTSEDFPTVNAWRYDGRWGDAFVLKLDPSGSRMLYSTWIGATEGRGIAVDGSGAAYVAGLAGPNVPTTPGALKEACLECRDVGFVTKLAPSGSSLLYSTYLGGDDLMGSEANDIAIDAAGNAYVTGTTYWHDFPTTPRAFAGQYEGYGDVYVAKLNPSGSALVYATLLGGTWTDLARGIDVDSAGHAYVVGRTRSTDFPVTAGARSISCNGYGEQYCQYDDAFITKLSADGSALRYSTFFGGYGNDAAGDVALDAAGNVYITGSTGSTNFPIAEAFQVEERGEGCSGEPYTVCTDAFVTKFLPDWSLAWSTYLGGDSAHDGTDGGAAIAVDAAGSAYVTGWTSAVDFPLQQPIDPTCGTSGDGVCDQEAGDAFLTKLTFIAPLGACRRDGTVLTVAVPENGAVTLARSGSDIAVSGTAPCSGATVSNVATINVVAGAGDESVLLDLAGGPFAPGARAELDGGSEIKFSLSLGPGADTLAVRGGLGDDRLGGLWTGGVDLNGDYDADVARSDAERTTFAGGPGADVVYAAGYPRAIEIDGGGGDDVLYGGHRNDTLVGGDGNDTLDGWSSDDELDGGDGGDTLLGGAGDDVLRGGAGDDVFQGAADAGADVMQGGPGADTASYEGADWRVVARIDDLAKDAGEGDDIGSDVEDLYGGIARDELTGNGAGNVIQGGPGNDHVDGRGGADLVLTRDGVADTVLCGGEHDQAVADAVDEVSADCETVQRDGNTPGTRAPPNDSFGHARPLSNLEWEAHGVNTAATKEIGEPNHAGVAGGRSVWYRWTLAHGGITTVTVYASGFDPVLAAYTGGSVSDLTEVASNDEDGPDRSRIRFRAAPGAVYYLAVDGEHAETGSFRIFANVGPAQPVNDFFDDAVVLAGESGTIDGTTAGASVEPGEPNGGSASLWWRLHATRDTSLVLETGRSTVRPAVAVYRGTTVSTLTQLPDQSGTTSHAFALAAGTTYHVQIADGGTLGNFEVAWRLGPPVDDEFVNARWLDYPETIVQDSNAGADREPGEPVHAGVTGAASVWFRWTAPVADTAYVWTSGSTFDTLLGVYTGSSVGNLTEIAANDDHPALTGGASRVSFTTVRGRVYYIAVDGKAGATGLVNLEWDLQSYACACTHRDHITEPLLLSGPVGSVSTSNFGDGKNGGEPDHAGNSGGASIWSRWQAPADGATTIETTGSTFDTLLAVYTNGEARPYYSGLQLVASNDDAGGGTTSRVTFTADGGTTYWIAVDGKSNGIDVAQGEATLQWSLARDPAAPSVALTSPAPGAAVSGVAVLSASASDDVGVTKVEFLVNGVVWFTDRTQPYAVSWNTNTYPYPTGSSTLLARAYDASGNVTDSQPRVVTVSNAPETTIVRAPPVVSESPNAGFGFSGRDGSTFACSLDDGAWTACSYSAQYNGLAEGVHTFRVRATYGGSTDPTPATWRWTVLHASNDDFTAAKALSGASGGVHGTVYSATKEPGEPNHGGVAGGSSVWYRWTAPATVRVRIDTMGSLFDTALGVYTGTSVAGLTLVAGDNDGGGAGRSKVVFEATAGTTYYVAVDAAWSTSYSALFRLNWGPFAESPRPPNDDLASAEPLSGDAGAVTGANGGATKEPGEPRIAGWLGGTSVWYRWTAPASGPAVITTAGSGLESLLGVYTGSSPAALVLVAEAEDIFDWGATVRFEAVAGTTYRIAVDGKLAATGKVALSWRVGRAPPPNDMFAAATALSGADGAVAGTNVAATDEYGEPFHADNAGGASVWYSWTAPQTGTATFETEGSGFDTLLAVYTGDALYQLVPRASDDDSSEGSTSRATFVAVAGRTYRIAVDGYSRSAGAAQGAVRLGWRTAALPADRSPPSAGVTQPAPEAIVRGIASLAATASDDLAVERVDFLADGTVIGSDTTEPYTLTWDSTTVPSGRTILAARAVDVAGKMTTTARPVVVDNTPPETTVTSGPPDGSTSPNPTFTFVSSEEGYYFQCRLDGADWSECSSPTRYYSLAPGTHTFEVRAFDRTWQYDDTPAERTWTISTAPRPANDDFVNAASLASPVSTTTVGATRETGEPNHADAVAGGGKSVWYRWTGDGTAVTLDLVADFPGAVVAVYTGTAVSSLGQVAKGDGRWGYPAHASFTSTAGTVYRIAVDGGLASGEFRLAWSSHDIIPPETSVTGGPYAETTERFAELSFTSTEAGSSFECSLDGAPWGGCSPPQRYQDLNVGRHVFRVRAADPAGNVDATPAQRDWVVTADTTPPETSITDGPKLRTTATWAWFDFTAEEWGASFECALDGSAFSPCTSPRGFVDLAPGTHTFLVRATDAAGNRDASPAARTWTVEIQTAPDTTPPGTPTLSSTHSSAWSRDRIVEVTWSGASDDGSGVDGFSYEWSQSATTMPDTVKDAEETATGTTSPELADGQWWFHLRTRDNAGNWSDAVHLGPFRIDGTAPASPTASSSSHSVATWSSDSTVDVSWSGASDPHSGVDGYSYEWSQSATTAPDQTKDPGSASATSPLLSAGDWWFHLRTVDNAGNWGQTVHLGPFRIDTAAAENPTLSSAHPSGWSRDTTVQVTWSAASDDRSGVDGFSYLWTQSPTTAPDTVKDAEETATGTTSQPLADGEWWFHLRTGDNASNWSSPTHLGPFRIDTTAPANPSLSSPSHAPGDWSNDPTVDVSWTGASDATSGVDGYSYEWSPSSTAIPDETKDSGTTTATSPTLADGDWWFHLRTVDVAGNWSTTVHLGPFRIDTTAPTSPTLSSPSHTVGAWSNDKSVVVEWSGVAGHLYSYDWSESDSTIPDASPEGAETRVVSARPDGSWWFHVRSRDDTGSWSGTSHMGPFLIDTTAPETQVAFTPPGFEFSASEPAVFRCALDGEAYADCVSPVRFDSLPPGEHVFRVFARDRANNMDPTPAEHRWTIAAPPAPPPPSPPSPPPPPLPPPPAPPPPAPPPTSRQAARCVVPRLAGRTLTRSRTLIVRAGCRLGRVTRIYSARFQAGRVVKQRPRAGLRLRRGARIDVTVSRGRR